MFNPTFSSKSTNYWKKKYLNSICNENYIPIPRNHIQYFKGAEKTQISNSNSTFKRNKSELFSEIDEFQKLAQDKDKTTNTISNSTINCNAGLYPKCFNTNNTLHKCFDSRQLSDEIGNQNLYNKYLNDEKSKPITILLDSSQIPTSKITEIMNSKNIMESNEYLKKELNKIKTEVQIHKPCVRFDTLSPQPSCNSRQINERQLAATDRRGMKRRQLENKNGNDKKIHQLKLTDMLTPNYQKRANKKLKSAICENIKNEANLTKNLIIPANSSKQIDYDLKNEDFEFYSDKLLEDLDMDKIITDESKARESLKELKCFDKTPIISATTECVLKTNIKPSANKSKLLSKIKKTKMSFSKDQQKYNFFPTVPKKHSKICVDFKINNSLERDISMINADLSNNSLLEIGFTLLFSEGFSQMQKIPGAINKICTPCGIMFYTLLPDQEFKFYSVDIRRMCPSQKELLKNFMLQIMTADIRKTCYEAQEFIMLLFDLLHLKREDICLKWDIIDPKIGCFLLDPDNPPSSFLNVLSILSMNSNFKTTNNCLKQKAAHFLILLSQVCLKLYERLNEHNLWKVLISMETRLITILAVMEIRGICVDLNVLAKMKNILQNKLLNFEKEAYRVAGKSFQLNSPSQLRVILFDELKLDTKYNLNVKKTMKLGAKSTSECVLRSLVPHHPLPAIILNYRNIYKSKVTFIDRLLEQSSNGIITTNWEQTSAATGRITSCNPNLQAIPKQPLILNLFFEGVPTQTIHIRRAFIPRPGYSFVAADFHHIECRIFAHLTQDEKLIEIFKSDTDIFTSLARKWMNKSDLEGVSMEDRNKTKHLVYALMYGAGAQKLSEILNMGVMETSQVIAKFLATFPSLQSFKHKILKKCRQNNGILHSLYGRVRKFPNINSPDHTKRAYCERQAINFVIQGSAADLCKLAMIATEYRLCNLPESLCHHLLLQIHDELMWEVPDENLSIFIDIVQCVMQHSGEFCGELSVSLPVSIVKGKSWGNMS